MELVYLLKGKIEQLEGTQFEIPSQSLNEICCSSGSCALYHAVLIIPSTSYAILSLRSAHKMTTLHGFRVIQVYSC